MLSLKRLLKILKFQLLENYNLKNFYFIFKNNKIFFLVCFFKYIYRVILIKLTFSKKDNIHIMLYGFNKYDFEYIANLIMLDLFDGKKYKNI